MEDNTLNNYENYEAYWDLVNSISDLCNSASESGLLFGDDIVSALDRVKFYKVTEYMEYRYKLEHEDDNDIE